MSFDNGISPPTKQSNHTHQDQKEHMKKSAQSERDNASTKTEDASIMKDTLKAETDPGLPKEMVGDTINATHLDNERQCYYNGNLFKT